MMNGNGMGMNPLELSLSALEGSISPEAQGVIGVPPAGTAADPFFDVPTTPNPLPRMREPTRTEVRRMEAAADRAVAARLSPALKRFGEIAKLVPGAERVRVRKRLPTGQIGPIGEWSLRDIQTSGDLEAFLMQYVRPRWKGGDYHLAVIDGSGREHDAGMIPMPDPPTDSLGLGAPASSEGHLDLVRDMMNRMERTMQPQAPVDPLEQIRRAKAMISELNGGQQNTNDATLAMMLAMQQQQRPAGPDPMMVQLLERLATKVEKLEQGNAALAAMPPPLPLPPATPSLDIPAITNLLATVAVPLIVKMMDRNDDRDRITPRDMIELLERRRTGDEDRLTARDAIALVRDLQSSVPQQSISDKMSELAALRELAQGLAGPGASSGPAQTTFWDALAAFASNKHFGDAIGKVLGGEVDRRRGPQVATLPPQPRELPAPAQQTLPPRSQPWTPTTVAASASGAPPQQAVEGARPAAPARVVLPDSFAEYAKRMNEATDSEAFVLATIEGLNDLRPAEQWSTFVRAMLEGVVRNDRESVLRGLRNWTALLAQNGILKPEVIDRSQAAFTEHWDAVHATITSMFGAPQQMGSQQSPAQSPVTAPGPVGPTSSPNGDDEDDDGGPPPVA